jgi:molybdopterin/thiamine biosynthesis adenylyltransferase
MSDAPRLVVRLAELAALPLGRTSATARARDDGDIVHLRFDPARAHDAGAPLAASIVVRSAPPAHADDAHDTHASPTGHIDIRADVVDASPDDAHAPLRILVSRKPDGTQRIDATLTRDGTSAVCEVIATPDAEAVFVRNHGLVAREVLANRTVIIFGVGSGGSTVAVELAKAGVGRFILFDPDHVSPENIARHACGLSDLGRMKVHAVADLLRNHNPDVVVEAFPYSTDMEERFARDAMNRADLVIGATDEPASRGWINRFACSLRIPAIFGRVTSRAAGGDVLRVRPGVGPCVACIYAAGLDGDESLPRRPARGDLPEYVSPEDRARFVQPGLAIDIAPVALMMTRLALVELSRGTPAAMTGLEEDFEADFYLWANRREKAFESWPRMAFGSRTPSILRWYGAATPRDPACLECAQARASERRARADARARRQRHGTPPTPQGR